MISNYRASVGSLTVSNRRKISIRPTWSIRGNEPEFICRSGKKNKNTVYPVYRPAHSEYQSTALQQYKLFSLTAVSLRDVWLCYVWQGYLLKITGDRYHWHGSGYILSPKSKIHNNLGQKEHSTHPSHPHSLFVNLQKIFTPTPLITQQQLSKSSHLRIDTCDKMGRNSYCK